ncbi:MAG: hypothetical protein ABR925_03785 [Acidimicrobiales bacterium]
MLPLRQVGDLEEDVATESTKRVGRCTNTLHGLWGNSSCSLQLGKEGLDLDEETGDLLHKVADHWLASQSQEGIGLIGGVECLIDQRDVVTDVPVVELLPEDTTKALAPGIVRDGPPSWC